MNMEELHAHTKESMESISASPLSLFVSFSIRFFPNPFASLRIDVLFSSFGIYGIVVASRLQSSPSIFWTESRCAQHRSPSLAQWISLIRSYAHMSESTEVTAQDHFGSAALHYVSQYDKEKTLRILLDAGTACSSR